MGTREVVGDGFRKLGSWARARARIVAGVSAGAAVVAGVAGAVMVRRNRARPELPDPAAIGAEAGSSIHNAVKATVIMTVRSAEAPDAALVTRTVREAMEEARGTGADVVAVAVGAVEAAVEVAYLLGTAPRELAKAVAHVAVETAERQGEVAAQRVEQQFATLLSSR